MTSISKFNSRVTLDFLQKTTENQYFERKWIYEEDSVKPAKLANVLISMLNADGGILALWISDSGEIDDLNTIDIDLLNRYRSVVHDFIKPACRIQIEEVILATGELILLYHIDQDYEHMFMRKDNEDVYLRVGDKTIWPLSRDECRKLEYDKSLRRFEDEDRIDFSTKDFDEAVLELYKRSIDFEGTYDELMLSRHLAKLDSEDRIIYKNSAILLFSKEPEKYVSSAHVRYVRYKWTEQLSWQDFNVIKDQRFYWSIPTLVHQVKSFLWASLRDYYFLDKNTWRFVTTSEYPGEAWLEWLVNALCHRSYNIQGNGIYIRHFDDRLEISNSWPLPAQVTVENIQNTRFSRNPRIARVLSELGFVRELNEWVKRIFQIMEESSLSSPEYKDKDDIVTLTLRNDILRSDKAISDDVMRKIEASWSSYNETQRTLLDLLFRTHSANLAQFAVHTWKWEEIVRKYLGEFVENGILERLSLKIRDKNALYVFKWTSV